MNALRTLMSIRREELPRALLMFAYFFLVICTFWVLKPLKKGVFLAHYRAPGFELAGVALGAAEAEQLAKVLNMVVAFVAMVAFTALSDRLRRERLAVALSSFFVVTCVAFAMVLDTPGPVTVWSFYLFGDLYSTLMVAGFFAFLNDTVDADAAARTYGIIGLGGVVGGVVGTGVLAGFLRSMSTSSWVYVCAALSALIVVVAIGAAKAGPSLDPSTPSSARDRLLDPRFPAIDPNPALAGAKLVFGSRYLLSVAAIVAIYEMVSTIMDFQFSATVAHYLEGDAIGQHLAKIFLITNVVSLLVQLFVTSPVMQRFGVTAALLVLPVVAGLGSTAFALLPGLWLGSLLNTADNGFSYSIHQSAKESLYVTTTADEKYKAKAFIDMFGQRFAKAVAVGLNLLISQSFAHLDGVRGLSIATLVLLAGWGIAARYAGRRFDEEARAAVR